MGTGVVMIIKKIKEYGKTKRQRIDLAKSDGFNADEDVVIIPVNEYDGIKQNILNLTSQLRSCEDKVTAKDSEIEIYKDQEQNLKQIVEDVTAPIYKNHKKEIEKKDNEIKQLQDQLKALQQISSNYNIRMGGLSAIDIVFRKKHKDLIEDFNSKIWIINQDNQVEDLDLKKLPGKDNHQEQ